MLASAYGSLCRRRTTFRTSFPGSSHHMARYPSKLSAGDEVQGIEVQGQLENNGKYKMGYRDGGCAASHADDITDDLPWASGFSEPWRPNHLNAATTVTARRVHLDSRAPPIVLYYAEPSPNHSLLALLFPSAIQIHHLADKHRYSDRLMHLLRPNEVLPMNERREEGHAQSCLALHSKVPRSHSSCPVRSSFRSTKRAP